MGASESKSGPLTVDGSLTDHKKELEDKYLVSDSHGFIIQEPKERLPDAFAPYEDLAKNLDKYVSEGQLREKVCNMSLPENLDIENLTKKELLLAHLIFSFITSGFVWQYRDQNVANTLPKCVAVPLCKISDRLGMKPILSYPSMILANWKIKDTTGPHEMQNMDTLYDTPGGDGASWFILTHNCIEKEFAPVIGIILNAMEHTKEPDVKCLTGELKKLPGVFDKMKKLFKRIKEECEPKQFYDNLRIYYAGWDKESKNLSEGLIYEGVNDDKPQHVTGGSAAQSTTLQIVDVSLGIIHKGKQKDFIENVRNYMLKEHREFIDHVQRNSRIRATVEESGDQDLVRAYNSCISSVIQFREFHLQWIVKEFIMKQIPQDENENAELKDRGSAGTKLGEFLDGILETTKEATIKL